MRFYVARVHVLGTKNTRVKLRIAFVANVVDGDTIIKIATDVLNGSGFGFDDDTA